MEQPPTVLLSKKEAADRQPSIGTTAQAYRQLIEIADKLRAISLSYHRTRRQMSPP